VLYKDKDWLYNEYIVLEKSIPIIAKFCKVSTATIWRLLKQSPHFSIGGI